MSRRVRKITCKELKEKIDNNETFYLFDVREPEEFEICCLDWSILVPLSEFEDHIDDFDIKDTYVIHSKGGKRSEQAALFMRDKGFKNVKALKGGIVQWAKEIDSKLEIY